jgi:hypothetical protein
MCLEQEQRAFAADCEALCRLPALTAGQVWPGRPRLGAWEQLERLHARYLDFLAEVGAPPVETLDFLTYQLALLDRAGEPRAACQMANCGQKLARRDFLSHALGRALYGVFDLLANETDLDGSSGPADLSGPSGPSSRDGGVLLARKRQRCWGALDCARRLAAERAKHSRLRRALLEAQPGWRARAWVWPDGDAAAELRGPADERVAIEGRPCRRGRRDGAVFCTSLRGVEKDTKKAERACESFMQTLEASHQGSRGARSR